jgi:ribosomal 50S subunit-recycling heat shock protein
MTSIDNLLEKPSTNEEEVDEGYLLLDNVIEKTILDLCLPLHVRIKAIERVYEKGDVDYITGLLQRLAMLYQVSGVVIIKNYLIEICTNCKIDSMLKSVVAKSICYYNKNDEIGYKLIDQLFSTFNENVGTPYKLELIHLLLKHPDYKEKATNYLCEIVNNNKLQHDYRYKTILSMENLGKPEHLKRHELENTELTELANYVVSRACLSFLENKENLVTYRILSAQYLLQKCKISEKTSKEIQQTLLSFSKDDSLDHGVRADATDVLLQLGNDENKEAAREHILYLGRLGGKDGEKERIVRTLYDNAENVHTHEFEESIKEGIEFLHSFEIMTMPGAVKINEDPNRPINDIKAKQYITFEYVEKEILKLVEKEKKEKKEKELKEDEAYEREDKIRISLNRIFMDRAIYSNYHCSLLHILLRIWTYIVNHPSEEEMKKRLLEELEEMCGTCSSGFITRLINTISSFGDFSLKMSWRDQIIGNLNGRLNAKARNLDDNDFQEKVLVEMTMATDSYDARRHFLKFFRNVLLEIREEMYEEFKNHIDDTSFDLYFRDAISMYETGSFV